MIVPMPVKTHWGWDFADDICKCIFLNENVWISLKFSLEFVPKARINNITALIQIMAWYRSGDKLLSEPMVISLLAHICVTRPHWVYIKQPWSNVELSSKVFHGIRPSPLTYSRVTCALLREYTCGITTLSPTAYDFWIVSLIIRHYSKLPTTRLSPLNSATYRQISSEILRYVTDLRGLKFHIQVVNCWTFFGSKYMLLYTTVVYTPFSPGIYTW